MLAELGLICLGRNSVVPYNPPPAWHPQREDLLMRTTYILTLFALLLLPSVGCAGNRFAASRWTWWHPGRTQEQRVRASVHDPYSDQDLGPEVVGGRPREFQNQYPEAVRNRFFSDTHGR